MARATREAKLETRTARDKLKISHHPYFKLIGDGLHLGYRKGKKGGKWIVRYYDKGQYKFRTLGEADDFRDANGHDVFTYFEAQDKARVAADDQVSKEDGTPFNYTVNDAVNDYLDWFKLHRKSYKDAAQRFSYHILPVFANKLVSELTTKQIASWHHGLLDKITSTEISEAEALRKKKASANRILTYLKAALNYAFRYGHIQTDVAWRRVKPFEKVDQAKIRFLMQDECIRLINACDEEFRPLVQVALLTGCRYGELVKLKCYDYTPDPGTIHFRETKSGKPRHTPLTDEGKELFEQLTAGRDGNDHIFQRNGTLWTKSLQARRMIEACRTAKIEPVISFHVLRHTYGSLLAMKGVSLQVIAEVLGHSDTRMTIKHYAHLQPSYVADTIRANLPSFGIKKSNLRILKQGA
ncbi:MAG TPA: hypothetical protein DD641_09700 [Deltaproteobacteria bacterium]|nr:hypothetical protein [Deltaproteobacteria bacterium]